MQRRQKGGLRGAGRCRGNRHGGKEQQQKGNDAVLQRQAIDLKGGALTGAVAPGTHGIGGDHRAFQRPAGQRGEHGDAALQLFPFCAAAGFTDALPCAADLPRFFAVGRHQTQHHHQNEGQRRYHIGKKGGEFVRSHHRAVAQKPQQHRHQHGGNTRAVHKGFIGERTAEQGEKHRITHGVKEGVEQRHHKEKGNHAKDGFPTLSALQRKVIGGGTDGGYRQIGRMHQNDAQHDGNDEKSEVHRRMAAGKSIVSHINTRPHPHRPLIHGRYNTIQCCRPATAYKPSSRSWGTSRSP